VQQCNYQDATMHLRVATMQLRVATMQLGFATMQLRVATMQLSGCKTLYFIRSISCFRIIRTSLKNNFKKRLFKRLMCSAENHLQTYRFLILKT
jgi:hypothetical protein